MAVDDGNANGEAPVAHAVEGDGPDVERSTVPEMLRQNRPSGMFYAHISPTEVVDGVPVIADQGLYDICIRNRARAHSRSLHARYEPCRALSTCWPNTARPAMLGTAWPRPTGTRSLGPWGHSAVYTRPYHTYIVMGCFYRCKCLNSPTRRQQGGWHPHPNQQLSG